MFVFTFYNGSFSLLSFVFDFSKQRESSLVPGPNLHYDDTFLG